MFSFQGDMGQRGVMGERGPKGEQVSYYQSPVTSPLTILYRLIWKGPVKNINCSIYRSHTTM